MGFKINFQRNNIQYFADLGEPIDLSIPLIESTNTVGCFYAPPVHYEPVRAEGFVGSILEGGPVNFFNVRLNPHGNGTHTECVGHIAKERYTIRECLQQSHFFARIISVYPTKMENGDRVILPESLRFLLEIAQTDALVIRTLPNPELKKRTNYSGTNPPYFHPEAIAFLVENGVQHLLTDLPSVDREEDGGALAAHKAFWQYPGPNIRTNSTITELIFVPDTVKDGVYLLDIQTASFDLDASVSKPLLYQLEVSAHNH